MPYPFHYQNDTLYCDRVSLHEIARAAGTPAWVYSRARIEENYRALADAFAPLNPEIHYSLKANANLTVLRLLANLGAGADVVSAGEIFRALRAGFPAESIVFAGVGKTRAELQYALEVGVGWFNVESAQELGVLNQLAAGASPPRVALRLNPDVAAETHAHMATGHAAAKFGIDPPTAARLAREWFDRFPHLRLGGVHLHIGSQLATPTPTTRAVQAALAFIDQNAGAHAIEALNIGGGYPIAYDTDAPPAALGAFAEALASLLQDAGLRVMLEPGRRVIGDAGALLVEVQYVKQRAGARFVIADGGMGDLIRPALYNARHRVWPVRRSSEPATPAHLAGPICESSDFLAHDAPLPPLEPGNLLAVLDAGAYGATMSTTYNARPLAPEVLVDGDRFEIVRRRQTWEDLVRLEEDVNDKP